ncbi:hypothetical protein SEA_TINALIN_72 [Gordonia phage TinaLin]|uniref:Uncharacterized protein n=1 Tax=Gordonia phage TinaLin TaxID=2797324 RepID=A0A7T7GTG2_9CAUD|nr:hypothetical protein KDJ60_gp34 [Gordonia phage TinaLin]QQM15160.1 hypothetical protein SEA_TINALIN_72 [Gordonia phage TinaLin]
MDAFTFEDWNGDTLELSPSRHSAGVVEVVAYGQEDTIAVDLPHGAIPNTIAYLYGQLDRKARARVVEGLLEQNADMDSEAA